MNSWNGAVNSVVRACARSTCSSTSTSRRVRSPSEGEEDGLIGSLQVDVEAVAAVHGLSEQRGALRLREPGQDGVGGVGLRLVGEVDAGDDPVEQPAREHGDVDVRGLLAVDAARLDRGDLPAAVVVGGRAPEAAEAGVE